MTYSLIKYFSSEENKKKSIFPKVNFEFPVVPDFNFFLHFQLRLQPCLMQLDLDAFLYLNLRTNPNILMIKMPPPKIRVSAKIIRVSDKAHLTTGKPKGETKQS